MENESAEISHPKFRIWLRSDGIAQIVWVPAAVMILEDAVAAMDDISRLTGGKRCPLLVDAHDAGPMDKPARSEFVRRSDLVTAVAILVSTPLSRIMGNFFIAVSKPVAPTRLFADEPAAVNWLREFTA